MAEGISANIDLDPPVPVAAYKYTVKGVNGLRVHPYAGVRVSALSART
jgi:hypothetical protein